MSYDWQPIETAPKDGTVILGYRGDVPEKARIAVICWLPDEWRGGSKMWSGSAVGLVMGYPTHWMPLPTAPANPKAD